MEVTLEMIGSVSSDYPHRTSLGKVHGPKECTQPKEVTWKPTGLVALLSASLTSVSCFHCYEALCANCTERVFRRRPKTGVRAEPNYSNGSETLGNCQEDSVG